MYENYYGTLATSVGDWPLGCKCLIVTVDVQGAATLRERFPEAVSIFIDSPPEVALKRIVDRGNYPGEIRSRIAHVAFETEAALGFDYRVENINGDPEKAIKAIMDIILSSLHRQ